MPESLLVFCNSVSWCNTGHHVSLILLVSARDHIDEVPGDCLQEISAQLYTMRLLKFVCKYFFCTQFTLGLYDWDFIKIKNREHHFASRGMQTKKNEDIHSP